MSERRSRRAGRTKTESTRLESNRLQWDRERYANVDLSSREMDHGRSTIIPVPCTARILIAQRRTGANLYMAFFGAWSWTELHSRRCDVRGRRPSLGHVMIYHEAR